MPNPVRQSSLLPQQIPPQTAALGAVTVSVKNRDGADIGTGTGTVTMDVNWWLFLYNIAKQLLAGGPGVPVPISPVDTIALVDGNDISSTDAIQSARQIANVVILEGIDIDLARPDVAGLPTRINNAQLVDVDPDVTPTLRDMANALILASDGLLQDPVARDLANAIVLATDGLLQDPAPQAQPTIVVTISGSPFTYTAPFNGVLSVTGGTVSLISIIRGATTVATGITSGLIPLRRGDQAQISQSGVPTAIFLPN